MLRHSEEEKCKLSEVHDKNGFIKRKKIELAETHLLKLLQFDLNNAERNLKISHKIKWLRFECSSMLQSLRMTFYVSTLTVYVSIGMHRLVSLTYTELGSSATAYKLDFKFRPDVFMYHFI